MRSTSDIRSSIRRLNWTAALVVLVFGGGVAAWAATAQLSGAVIAPAQVVVDSNVKRVQHPTGGVVGELLVRDGALVAEGQVLLRLDDTVTRANLGVIRSQLDELRAREARLLAERDAETRIAFPAELTSREQDATVGRAIGGEQRLMEARRTAREGQRNQLGERITQLREEIRGLEVQVATRVREVELIRQELTGVAQLYRQNLVSTQRYIALQRDETRIEGDRGKLLTDIARSRGQIAEIETQILRLDQDFRAEVLTQLRETQGRIAELQERRIAAEDQLQRIDIRAPQAGVVHQLAVHTVGGVVQAGETLMLIVPQSDALALEARVAANDIDQVTVSARATVKLMAGNQRTMPDLHGTVSRVGADLTREQNGAAYYIVRLVLPEAEIARLPGGLRLVPGMPAQVFIQTGDRTALDYLVRPLTEQLARTFRER
jgi:HlyD family secretion protein